MSPVVGTCCNWAINGPSSAIVIRAGSGCFKVVLEENVSRSVDDSYVVDSEAFLAVPRSAPSVVRGVLVTVYNEPDVD